MTTEPEKPAAEPAAADPAAGPRTIEQRMDRLEQRVAAGISPRTTLRAIFTCHYCGTSEERDVPDRPTAWVEVLQGVREEMRTCMQMDTPQQRQQPPPHDLQIEREVCAAAVLGIRHPCSDVVRRSHFFSHFFGWVWQIAREQEGRPNLAEMAYQFEARGLGRVELVLPELQRLAGPWIPARCDHLSIERLLALAWQRDMMYEAMALAGWLGQDVGVDVADIVARLKTLRDKLKHGPLGVVE
jgi:hypothetical protein